VRVTIGSHFFLFYICFMELKLLHQAMEFSPGKVVEFIINVYSAADPLTKAIFEAKFNEYFKNRGESPQGG